MRYRRCLAGALGAGVLAAVGLLPSAATLESQQPAAIGLSLDGREFTPTLDAPLFGPDVTWVPGDRRTAVVHVRNQAADAAEVAVELERADDPPPWLSVSAPDRVLEVPLAPGETRRVPLALTLAADAPAGAMGVSTDLSLTVRLTQTAPGAPALPGSPDGVLPDTGASLGPGLLAAGLGLLAGGAAVLATRRRTSRHRVTA